MLCPLRTCFWFMETAVSSPSPHMEEGVRELSGVSFMGAPEPPPPNTITLGSRFQPVNGGEGHEHYHL